MKRIVDRVFKFFHRYRKLVKLIDRKITFKETIKSVVSASSIALILVLPFVGIAINMFIYAKHTVMISIFLVLILMVWSVLYYFFYYRFLQNYQPKIKEINTTIPQWTETAIAATTFMVIGFI
ncbi:MAG: hypothetical protein EOM23_10495, partial [Candidatus Moranbacteria bacterium]|nr:hypothetical protein [Candidatus Moranbacteria bacterium]